MQYLIEGTDLTNIANAIRIKSGKTESISFMDFPSEISAIETFKAELPVLDSAYPKDATVNVIKGNTTSATFSVVFAAHGSPAEYTYQWYVDGVAVSGANDSTYTKTELSETTTYDIHCEVTNKAGIVISRIAKLNVVQQYTPVLNAAYPADVTIGNGSTISSTFTVQIDTAGIPANYTYQWYVDGVAVAGATSASYTKDDFITKKTFSIYCEVTNAAGTIQSRVATATVNHTILYINGNECTANTGGWKSGRYYSDSNNYKTTATCNRNSNNLSFTISSAGTTGGWGCKNKIDLTGFTNLKANLTTCSLKMQICVDGNEDWSDNSPIRYSVDHSTGTKTISVSSLNSSYYIMLIGWTGSDNTGTCTFNKVWLE